MLIGGIAVALWGEPRATQDIDIVVLISRDRVFDFLKEVKKYGFSYRKEETKHLLKANLLRLIWQKDFFLDRGFSVESMLFVHRSQCTKMAISEAWNSLSAIGELISSLSSMRKISL